MKPTARAFLVSLICITAASIVVARRHGPQPGTTVAGVYENFTVGKESGDLEGMRVVIVSAGGGYYAIVQIAQGGAEDPKPEIVADRKSTRLNSSHLVISYAVFCLNKKCCSHPGE